MIAVPSPAPDARHAGAKMKLVDWLHPNVVSAEHAWWYPEKPAPDHGVWDSNINVCTDADHCDPIIGSTTCGGVLCRVYPAAEGPPEGVQESL